MHDPFDIGGYTPFSGPSHLGVELQFEGTEGRACTILASELERVAHKSRPSGYGLKLVETARAALESYLREHVHAIRPKETPDA